MVSRILLISANRCMTSDPGLIEKILKHLGLWDLRVRPASKVKVLSVTISIDDSDSQVPFSTPPFYLHLNYSRDSFRFAKPFSCLLRRLIRDSAGPRENVVLTNPRGPKKVEPFDPSVLDTETRLLDHGVKLPDLSETERASHLKRKGQNEKEA